MLLCTDLSLPAIDIIRLYGWRSKIAVAFKAALRILGGYAYHFWMRAMKPAKRGAGDCHPHRETHAYRQAIRRKIDADHRFIQIGCIAQGMLHYLAIGHASLVWRHFGSWLRTIRPGAAPAKMVTAQALRNSLPEFLSRPGRAVGFAAFVRGRTDIAKTQERFGYG